MTTDAEHFSPLGRGWRWLNRFGLLVPLGIGAVLVAIIAITFISPRYQTPSVVNVGVAEDYAVLEPVYFEEQGFWLVHLPDGEFVALYNRDPASGCGLPFGFGFEHLGVTGWFRDACSGSTYDLTGACFGGPCNVGLNRLNVLMVDGDIIVDPADGPHGAFRSDNGDPVNPPQ
ncbi:MAG: hypothetical protein IIB85_05285 [Chloroflexi bacterium]|nr:hypothetical protein [Chloroflexota bacterium]